jgi:hypothetical protein
MGGQSANGYTGTAATSVNAWLTWRTSTTLPAPWPAFVATLSAYGPASIPIAITVPCSGTGVMLFLPAPGSPTVRGHLLAATLSAHEPATFGVHGSAVLGDGGGGRGGCWFLVPVGAEQAGKRGDHFLQEGVDALLLVGGASGVEVGDGAAVLGLGGKLPDPGGHGRADGDARAARGLASRG